MEVQNEIESGQEPRQKPGTAENSNSARYSGSIVVNAKQRGNLVLKSIRSVPWEFSDKIVPDYIIGQRACALFLSVKYHVLKPDYIHDRLKELGKAYELRVLLVLVDVKEPHHALKQLMRIAILSELTLMLAWSPEEAGKILETYKQFENKPPDMIMEKCNTDSYSKLIEALTSIKSVNKTDAVSLISSFGTLEKIINASEEELSLCPGFGPQKAHRLSTVLKERFVKEN